MADADRPLFARADGKQMCFYLPPSVRDKGSSTRAQIRQLIEEHGGKFRTPVLSHSQAEAVIQLVHVDDAGNEKVVEIAKERGQKLYFCTYVSDSVEKGMLMNLEDYEVRPSPRQVAPKRARYPWTPEEDAAILRFASKSLMARRGDTVWEDAEKLKITRHSWQAMKERYTKHLAPAQAARVPPIPFNSVIKHALLNTQLGHVASSPGSTSKQSLPLASPNAQSGKTSTRPASQKLQPRAEGVRRTADASAVTLAAEGPTSRVRPDVSQAGPSKDAPAGDKQLDARGAKLLQSPASSVLPSKKILPLQSPSMQAPLNEPTNGTGLLSAGQTSEPAKQLSSRGQAPTPVQNPQPFKSPSTEVQRPKLTDKTRPLSASIPNGQSSTQQLERLRSPPHSTPTVRGAAVLSASGKARVLRAVPPQDFQNPGTAAAGHEKSNVRQEIEEETPSLLQQDPFTQAPDVTTEALPWDFSELEEEPVINDDADENDVPEKRLAGRPAELGQQHSEQALREGARKRLGEDLSTLTVGKKQRTEGAQALVEQEGLAGRKAHLLEAIMEEGEGDLRRQQPAKAALDVRIAAGSIEEASDKRAADGHIAAEAPAEQSTEGARKARREARGTGAGKGSHHSEDGLREDHKGNEEALQSSTRKLEESRQRRLRRGNGELVGGSKKPMVEPPAYQTPGFSQGRLSEIRTWVALFMEEYSCSQDDVIKAVIEASGEFEAARSLLDQRVRRLVKGLVWSYTDDTVLLKERPPDVMRRDPAFHDLLKVFGQDRVHRRLEFLGRLGGVA